MRFLVFLFIVSLAIAGLSLYVHRRSARVFGLSRRARIGLGLGLLFGIVLLFGGRMAAFPLSDGGREIVAVIGTCIALGTVITAALLMHIDLLGGLWWGFDKARAKRVPSEDEVRTEPESESSPTTSRNPELESEPRRLFVTRASAAAILTGMGASTYGAVFGRHDYEIETVPIALPGLPRQLDGYTIVQLSDIHFGTFVQDAEARAAEALVQSARPDAIVLTGDLLDHEPEYAPFLGRLVRRLQGFTRDGVFAIPGNHDHYAGVEEVLETLRRAGATTLLNDGRGIAEGHISLLGVDDLWARREGWGPDLQKAIEAGPPGVPRILLAHQPVFFEEAAPHVQLQLSGHTHGGQVNFGYNPAEIVLPHGWVRGQYDQLGSTLYVNRGFGTAGPPARLFSAPEVTKIVLTSA